MWDGPPAGVSNGKGTRVSFQVTQKGAVAAAPSRSFVAPKLQATDAGASAKPSAANSCGVEVYDLSSGREKRVNPQSLNEGGDVVAQTAYRNAQKVDEFLKTTFNRNGWDNKGTPLKIVVHTPDDNGAPLNNAYWDASMGKVYLGDGDGRIFKPLGNSLDVLTHEATHALVDSEVNLRYSGQQGGINESWADVLGALADPDDWQIGEDVFTPGKPNDAIRDLANPRFAHTREIPPGAELEVHDMSGIPSLAAVRVAERIGRQEMGQIWYSALVDHLDSRAGFSGAARATLEAATQLYGHESAQFSAVKDAWKSVGVNPRFTPPEGKK
jgi:bacillolysin